MSHRPARATAFEKFAARFRSLAHSVNAPKATKSKSERFFFFAHGGLGPISLKGRQADLFAECRTLVRQIHPRTDDGHLLSEREADSILRNALLGAVRNPSGTESTFTARLEDEVSRLECTLLAEPRQWGVALRVAGIALESLPLELGLVTFSNGLETSKEVAKRVPRATRGIDSTPQSLAAEHRGRRQSRREIRRAFGSGAVAQTRVSAMDFAAARDLGIERTRRVVDAINFFAPFFREGPPTAPVVVAPAGPRAPLPYAVWPLDEAGHHFNEDDQYFRFPAILETSTARAAQVGLTRANELLCRLEKSDLDRRILTALSWAGRATVEPRLDESFVLYAVSIEALLGKHEARSGVTDRLRRRVVGLMGNGERERERVALASRITQLYQIRSQILHAGDVSDIGRAELNDLAFCAEQCIVTALTDPAICEMRSARALMSVLDERGRGLPE